MAPSQSRVGRPGELERGVGGLAGREDGAGASCGGEPPAVHARHRAGGGGQAATDPSPRGRGQHQHRVGARCDGDQAGNQGEGDQRVDHRGVRSAGAMSRSAGCNGTRRQPHHALPEARHPAVCDGRRRRAADGGDGTAPPPHLRDCGETVEIAQAGRGTAVPVAEGPGGRRSSSPPPPRPRVRRSGKSQRLLIRS